MTSAAARHYLEQKTATALATVTARRRGEHALRRCGSLRANIRTRIAVRDHHRSKSRRLGVFFWETGAVLSVGVLGDGTLAAITSAPHDPK
jgi:hypothetical protein